MLWPQASALVAVKFGTSVFGLTSPGAFNVARSQIDTLLAAGSDAPDVGFASQHNIDHVP
ncbi:MAG: hypothetical protein L0387_12995 [Acidobacteria bacterium]|nr:hypothetical protein [Acidobacteriota bacterium]